MINGSFCVRNSLYDVSGNKSKQKSSCQPHVAPCLFNIAEDPCEEYNVDEEHADIVGELTAALEQMSRTAVKPGNNPGDSDSNPKYWNNVWTNWKDYPSPTSDESRLL